VAEGGVATINVTRTGGTAAASINYATLDGSASSAGTAADYTTAAGTLNFAAGQTTASFTVTALTDSILESPETVNLVLSGGNIGSNPSILTILDVPPGTTPTPTPTPTSPSLFQFQQQNYTVAEGGVATINVTRTGGTAAASINYATVDGSASSPGDYTPAAGTLNFAAGQTTASFTVTALTDSILESPETVNLVLFGGNVGSNPSILTINDVATTVAPTPTPTPTPPTSTATQFVFSAATFTTPESSGLATVTVNRIGPTTAAGSIGYTTVDGTALSTGSAVDYLSTGGVLNFGPGQTTATFTIFVNPDTVPELTETVNLVLQNGPVGTPSTAILQIIDGSGSASGNVFQYSASNYGSIASPGGGTTVTVTRSSGLGAASVDYIILAGTPGTGPGATPAPVYGTDYLLNPGGPTGGTLSFANGQLSQTFTIQDNPFTTNNGIVNLGLANPTAGYSFGSTAATRITLI
ncbi:Calx-beta domain-containing protein, partial [Microcoleus sp. AR_TQ3_B6]|uniref:Calx-beta domain-containing protein n=1 Tax=Microcoleus sp. AR_TQ3_B6 TaxID=3055284 RepID=UPI002FD79C0D